MTPVTVRPSDEYGGESVQVAPMRKRMMMFWMKGQ